MKRNKLTQDKHSEQDAILWWNAARAHFTKKEYTKAIEVLNILLEADPDDINALINKGAALYFLKRYDEALQCFEIILNSQPHNANALKNKAGVLFNLGRYDEASSIYDLLLKNNKNDISILKNKALTLIKLKKKEEAIGVYKYILSIDLGNKAIGLKLADLLHEKNLYEDELGVYNNLLIYDPQDKELLNRKGLALISLEKYDPAVDIFNKVLSMDLDNIEALTNKKEALSRWNKDRKDEEELKTVAEYKTAKVEDLINEGNDLLDRKNYTKASACFDKALDMDARNGDAMLGKAIVLAVSDNSEDALRYFDHVLKKDPSNVKALINQGELLSRIGKYTQALKCFEAVLDLEPGNFRAICDKEDALINLQKAYIDSDIPSNDEHVDDVPQQKPIDEELSVAEKTQADTQIDKEIQTQANKPNPEFESLLSEGYALLKANKLNEALQTFTQAARIDSRNIRVLSFLGTTYYLQNKYEKANICYDKILESEPHNVHILGYKGNALTSLKQFDEAVKYYNQALSFDPDNLGILNSKASALQQAGMHNEAIECYNHVLQIESNNTDALYQLGVIYKDADEYAEALNCFDRLLSIDPNHNDAYQQKEEIELFIEQIIEEASLPDQHERLQRVAEANLQKTALADVVPNEIEEQRQEQSIVENTVVKDTVVAQDIATKPLVSEKEAAIEKAFDAPTLKTVKTAVEVPIEESIQPIEIPKIEQEAEEAEIQKTEPIATAQAPVPEKDVPVAKVEKKRPKPDIINTDDEEKDVEKKQVQAWANKAKNALQNRSWKKAIEALDQLLIVYPASDELINLKAKALIHLGEYSEAIACYDKVLAMDKDHVDALFNKGNALYDLHKYAEAIACYNSVLAIDKDHVEALNSSGNALTELGKYAEAIACYNQVLMLDKNDIDALYNKGVALGKSDKYDDANECFTKVLAIDKCNKDALHNKGVACFLTNQTTESAGCFAQLGYSSLDLLSLFSAYQDQDQSLFALIQAIIELNANDYFNQIVCKESGLRSVYKKIYSKSLQIVKMLHVSNDLENRVAHYTSHQAADALFGLKDAQSVSPFRLSSIASANDPKEGITLFDFMGNNLSDGNNQSDYQAFIGCFSFNTESLNQFHLYSKDSHAAEATGVNIVLNNRFFSNKIGFNSSLLSSANNLIVKEASHVAKESLFRCIYVDPQTSRIISLGHKEEYTIYRENEKITDTQADSYHTDINRLLVEIRKQVDELKQLLGREDLDRDIVRELLIVLRYLVKHVAFKEEQECRIINIERLQSDNVKLVGDRIFVEYQTMDCQNVDSVICAPLLDQSKLFRDILLKKTGIRAQMCKHPFACDNK